MEINIAEVAATLRVVTTTAQASELLNPLPAKALRLVALAYDPHFPALRAKAGRDELVSYLIRHTVGTRLWVAQWRAEHS